MIYTILNLFAVHMGETADEMNQYEDPKLLLNVTTEDYEKLPKHMKGLVSWEV